MSSDPEQEVRTFWNEVAEDWRLQVGEEGDVNMLRMGLFHPEGVRTLEATMTKSEYQELIEFLGKRFEAMDRRFDGIEAKLEEHDRRFDAVEAKLEEHDRAASTVEARLEEVGDFDRKLETLREQMDARFAEMMDLMKTSYGEIDRRITDLEASSSN